MRKDGGLTWVHLTVSAPTQRDRHFSSISFCHQHVGDDKVLLIDDESGIRGLLGTILERKGHAVLLAETQRA